MKKSKIAIAISTVYLLLVALSFVIMLMTLKSTPMAGIFLVMVTFPWSTIVGTLGDGYLENSLLLNGLLLLAGGILNGFLIYFLTCLIVGLVKKCS